MICFYSLTFNFLTQHINITGPQWRQPLLFCVSESPLQTQISLINTKTPCCFLPRLAQDCSHPVSQASISVSPEHGLNTMNTCIIQYVMEKWGMFPSCCASLKCGHFNDKWRAITQLGGLCKWEANRHLSYTPALHSTRLQATFGKRSLWGIKCTHISK